MRLLIIFPGKKQKNNRSSTSDNSGIEVTIYKNDKSKITKEDIINDMEETFLRIEDWYESLDNVSSTKKRIYFRYGKMVGDKTYKDMLKRVKDYLNINSITVSILI